MAPSRELVAFANALSRLFGWIYFLSWSASFYAQPIKNIQRRTTAGTTPDFPTANILGFLCLGLSNGALLFNPTIRAQYAARHPRSPEPTVRANDFAFALHAIFMCVVTWSQYMTPGLWGFHKVTGRERKVSLGIWIFCGAGIAVLAVFSVWAAIGSARAEGAGVASWQWLDVIYLAGYLKLICTVVKYVPQLVLNHRRRSTTGWSIWQILLDITGSVLSLAQLGIDSALLEDPKAGVLGNPVKLVLGNITFVYDALFVAQHYCMYRDGKKAIDDEDEVGSEADGNVETERSPLLGGTR